MKRTSAFVGALLVATPAMAKTGHVIQVHHGTDCVEFALFEDAEAACPGNIFNSNGSVNDVCMQTVPWYGIATGQVSGQTPLTIDQLPFFISSTSAIDTAYKIYQEALMLTDVQSEIEIFAGNSSDPFPQSEVNS